MSFGAYVHVPFCAARCDYCAFATWTDRDHVIPEYVEACKAEIEAAWRLEHLPEATSVFFGGGTPSRLDAADLVEILGSIPRSPDSEVTVECNPEDASYEKLSAWRSAGFNRISFGVQSTVPSVLRALGRRHTPGCVDLALKMATSTGFESVSVDLIFGAVGETDAEWTETLSTVIEHEASPRHVSAYALTAEPGTTLARDESRHPDEDIQAKRYEIADKALTQAGYRWYEISNWAKPGYRCRHNELYWSQGDYRGIGCAAHSHLAGRRFWNVRTPQRYVDRIRDSRCAVAGEENLQPDQRRFEALVLALRTSSGVPSEALEDSPQLAGLVRRHDGRAVLSLRGRLLANAVSAHLQT